MTARHVPVSRIILAATVAITAIQLFLWPGLVVDFALWPRGERVLDAGSELVRVGFAPWQLVTYATLHGGVAHLLLNALAMYMFGPAIERVLGSARYVVYWFACVVGAGATQLLVHDASGEFVPTVGASGGVFGLLLAYGVLFPRHRLMLVFPPIPMPAWLFVTLYAITELVFGVTNTLPGVAHFAHLGGLVTGIVLLVLWRRHVSAWRGYRASQ